MSKHWYDRVADNPVGGAALRYMLHGIDTNPSLFQRAAINAAIGTAYATDYMMNGAGAGSSTSPWNIRKRVRGGAGGHKRYMRGQVAAHMVGGYMTDLGQRHQHHVRGCGRLYGKHKRTPRAIVYNKRVHQNEPLTVSHTIKQELRSEPGSQAVVAMIGERLFPKSDYTGALYRGVDRVSDAPGAALASGGVHTYNEFLGASSVSPTATFLNHRRDWTMGTNGAWRDGYAFANGRLLNTTMMEDGYSTPFFSSSAMGVPNAWLGSPAVANEGTFSGVVADLVPDVVAANQATVLRNYYHLYEEISWKIQNNSVTGTTVTVYECILNRDIPLNTTPGLDGVTSVEWGGMPCPLELWRQSRELGYLRTAQLTSDGDFAVDGLSQPFNPIPAAEDEGLGVASSRLQRDPTAAGAQRGMYTADIDYPNVRPNKAALLHTYYKVVAHTRYLPPGADTTITVGVKYNKRIPGAWWNTMYGVANFTRCFFMVSRPDEVVGITGGDGSGATPMDGKNRIPVMNGTDLMVSWTKKKTVARTKMRTRHAWYYKPGIPTNLDTAIRNPLTLKVHDADVFMGEDADEAPEQPGA